MKLSLGNTSIWYLSNKIHLTFMEPEVEIIWDSLSTEEKQQVKIAVLKGYLDSPERELILGDTTKTEQSVLSVPIIAKKETGAETYQPLYFLNSSPDLDKQADLLLKKSAVSIKEEVKQISNLTLIRLMLGKEIASKKRKAVLATLKDRLTKHQIEVAKVMAETPLAPSTSFVPKEPGPQFKVIDEPQETITIQIGAEANG